MLPIMQAMRQLVLVTIAVCLTLQTSVLWAQPVEKRIGLAIGNAAYQTGALATPANDAGLVAQTLQAAGFDVVGARDLDEESLRHAVRDFVEKATAAGPEAVVFVYFAGYGLQLEGENYLVPVDAKIERDTDLPVQGLRVYDFVVRTLAATHPKASFVILDAARTSPFAQSGQPLAGGLALMEPPPGMLIAFNAAPGTVAPDGQGPYGPYAQALAEMMREGGLPVGEMFDRIRLRVNELTKGAQVPWSAANGQPPFVFFERTADAPPPAIPADQVATIRSRPIREMAPQEAYAAVLDRDTIGAYEEFIDAYPDDVLARRARAILAIRREAIVWRRTCVVDTPNAYWSYLRRYPNGPHIYDARRRLARFVVALEPPPVFPVIAYDVPPPPPEEIVFVDRPVLAFDDPILALPPPPPPPIFLLPPPPPEFIVLPPPPPPIGLFVLPTPVYRPVPVWVQPPVYVAPPPPNNVIFANIHNTVVINQAANAVSITTPSGQPVAPRVVQPMPGRSTPPQGLAPTGVTAAAIGPSLPPSVARRASLIQGPRGVAPTAPGQVLPGTRAAPIVPGQPRPGPNALGQPVPQSTLQQPLPGAGGQGLPPSRSAVPAQRNQVGTQRGRNAKPGRGQPLPPSASAVPGQTAPSGANPAVPGAPRSAQPPPQTPGAAPARSNKNLAVRPPPGQRPSQPPAAPQKAMHAPKPLPQAAHPPAPPPQAMRPPKPPPQAARPPAPAPQAMRPPKPAQAARRPAPAPQAMRPPKPPPQAVRPPAPAPQAMRPPKPAQAARPPAPAPQAMRPPSPAQVARPPAPPPQAIRPPASAKAARPGAPACPPGTHFATGKCVK
ncbi:MAG: caspase family protein [Rhodoplanes sp.]